VGLRGPNICKCKVFGSVHVWSPDIPISRQSPPYRKICHKFYIPHLFSTLQTQAS